VGVLASASAMLLHIREQQFKCAAVMIVRHDPSRDTARAIRCGWHQGHRQECTPNTSDP
jgi:hypothetical protein